MTGKILDVKSPKAKQSLLIDPSLEDFTIQRTLGTGAYATVKLATHNRLKRRFAIKIYQSTTFTDSLKSRAVD
jgi:serine/threonine protein kinase